MNLSTTYLGLRLHNPLIVGASPCCDDVDLCRRLEDADAFAETAQTALKTRYALYQHLAATGAGQSDRTTEGQKTER